MVAARDNEDLNVYRYDDISLKVHSDYERHAHIHLILMRSPERSGVVQCGDGVHRGASLPVDLFSALQRQLSTERKGHHLEFCPKMKAYIDAVLDAVSAKFLP